MAHLTEEAQQRELGTLLSRTLQRHKLCPSSVDSTRPHTLNKGCTCRRAGLRDAHRYDVGGDGSSSVAGGRCPVDSHAGRPHVRHREHERGGGGGWRCRRAQLPHNKRGGGKEHKQTAHREAGWLTVHVQLVSQKRKVASTCVARRQKGQQHT